MKKRHSHRSRQGATLPTKPKWPDGLNKSDVPKSTYGNTLAAVRRVGLYPGGD